MELISNKTLKQVEQEVDIFIYTKLIELEYGSLPIDEMCIKLQEEFSLSISEEELEREYSPTAEDMEEDYRLIYKNCVI